MSIYATQPAKQERELIKAGTHAAYLYRVIYLGTHKRVFDGKESQAQKIWIDFELPKEVVEYEDEKTKEKKTFVRSIGQEFTLSLHEKGKLLPMIQGWLGRTLTVEEVQSFDICTLLGKPTFLTIVHAAAKNGNTYANIASVAPIMEGYNMPRPFNKPTEIGKAEWDGEAYKALPEFLRKKIEESNEKNIEAYAQAVLRPNDDIPVIQIDEEMEMTMHQGENQTDREEIILNDRPF